MVLEFCLFMYEKGQVVYQLTPIPVSQSAKMSFNGLVLCHCYIYHQLLCIFFLHANKFLGPSVFIVPVDVFVLVVTETGMERERKTRITIMGDSLFMMSVVMVESF